MSLVTSILLRGLGISVVATFLSFLLRRRPGGVRHAVVVLAFVALLALPLCLRYVASPNLPRPIVSLPAVPLGAIGPNASSITARTAESLGASSQSPVSLTMGAVGPLILGGIYVTVAALLLARLAIGWGRAARWAHRSRPLDYDPGYGLDVRVSPEIEVPLALWWGRGIILLPLAHEEWSPERRDAVLRHERAHLQRADLLAMLLARLTLALHWPNPLVWSLVTEARRAAEDAADDVVLRSGVAPAEYATHLLDLAGPSRSTGAVFALAMAHRPDLKRRIRRMLHPRYLRTSRRSRGISTVFALVSASTLFTAVGVVGVVIVQAQPDGAGAKSWAPEVRAGLSKAATSANGFVGTLFDGREVQVERICRATPSGTECWAPDGTPLQDARAASILLLKRGSHARTIVTRFRSNSPKAEGALGSGPPRRRPSVMVFAGGYTAHVGDHQEVYSYVELPKEDSATASFTLGVSDALWETTATLPATVGKGMRQGIVEEPHIEFPITAKLPEFDRRGSPIIENEAYKEHMVSDLLRVAFWINGDEALREIRITAIGHDGRELAPIWHGGGYHGNRFQHLHYFRVRPADVQTFRIESQAYHHVELLDVRMKPNP